MALPPRRKLDISAWALALLLLPLGVLTGSELLLGYGGDHDLGFMPELLAEPQLVELTARYHAFAAFAFFISVSLAVTGIFICDVLWRFTRLSQVRIICAIVGVVLYTLIFSLVEPEVMKGFETYELLGEDVFRGTLGIAKTGSCLPDRATCTTGTAFDVMNVLVDISSRVVSLSASAVLIGIILSLAPVFPDASLDARISHIREARRCAKRYLYCAGLLLTAGMLWTQAWMSWPTSLIAEDAARERFSDMIGAFSLFRGTTYSLLILSIYLPVYLALSLSVQATRQVSDEETLEKESALEHISYTEALKTIAAILAPVLMSVIGSGWNVTLGL